MVSSGCLRVVFFWNNREWKWVQEVRELRYDAWDHGRREAACSCVKESDVSDYGVTSDQCSLGEKGTRTSWVWALGAGSCTIWTPCSTGEDDEGWTASPSSGHGALALHTRVQVESAWAGPKMMLSRNFSDRLSVSTDRSFHTVSAGFIVKCVKNHRF